MKPLKEIHFDLFHGRSGRKSQQVAKLCEDHFVVLVQTDGVGWKRNNHNEEESFVIGYSILEDI